MLTGRSGARPDLAYRDFPADRAPAGKIAKGQLLVVIDFKSPQAYLAIGPTCALADEIGIGINWQPLIVTPSKTSAAPSLGDDRGALHRRFRADYLDRDIARSGAD